MQGEPIPLIARVPDTHLMLVRLGGSGKSSCDRAMAVTHDSHEDTHRKNFRAHSPPKLKSAPNIFLARFKGGLKIGRHPIFKSPGARRTDARKHHPDVNRGDAVIVLLCYPVAV